jgi:hypothetical protein
MALTSQIWSIFTDHRNYVTTANFKYVNMDVDCNVENVKNWMHWKSMFKSINHVAFFTSQSDALHMRKPFLDKRSATAEHPGLPGVLYVASKLRFFTPGPIHRISSRDGCYLAMGCLPLNIYIFYFEGVSSSVQRPRAWRYGSGVSRKCIVGTPASVHGSEAVGVACVESMNWVRVTGAGQVHLSHIGGCAPDCVIWLATLLRSGVRDGIIMDACRASTAESGNAMEGAVCTGCRWIK